MTLCYLHCPPLSNQTPQRLRVIHGLPIASARASAKYYFLGFAGLWARVTNPMRYPQGLVFALYFHIVMYYVFQIKSDQYTHESIARTTHGALSSVVFRLHRKLSQYEFLMRVSRRVCTSQRENPRHAWRIREWRETRQRCGDAHLKP